MTLRPLVREALSDPTFVTEVGHICQPHH
jgi:hypothetical protein